MNSTIQAIGRGLSAFGAGVNDPSGTFERMLQERQQEEKKQQLQQLGSVLSGAQTPAYAKQGGAEGLSPQQVQQQQNVQLANLGTPEAINLLAQRTNIQPSSPASPLGKLQSDISKGFIPQNIGQQALNRAIQPQSPLVQVNSGERESAFEREIGKKTASSISTFIEDQTTKTAELQNSLQAVNEMENLLNQGIKTGGFADVKIGLGEAIRFLGGDPSRIPALENINELETLSGLTNKLIIPIANELGYNPTDADANRIESSVAGIGKGVEANRALIGFLRNTVEKQTQIQSLIDDVVMSGDSRRLRRLRPEVNKLRRAFLDEEIAKLGQINITKKVPNVQSDGNSDAKVINFNELVK